jgi:hypothetical protein
MSTILRRQPRRLCLLIAPFLDNYEVLGPAAVPNIVEMSVPEDFAASRLGPAAAGFEPTVALAGVVWEQSFERETHQLGEEPTKVL